MDDEVLGKLRRISASSLTEADVQHLFTLARKLSERVPKADSSQYAVLRFFCDWTMHSKIDRSAAGANILARIHDLVADHLKKDNNATFAADLSAALSLDSARTELNNLVERFSGVPDALSEEKWRDVIPLLAEIISHCPLKIGPKNRVLTSILNRIRSRPLKGTSVVEELSVIKVPSVTFNAKAPNDEFTYCLMLITTDTTRIVTPLVRI